MKRIITLVLFISTFSLWGKSECLANYDDLGIVHQEYESEEDYYYCFGFHHGKDRAWQMDFFRRFTKGENAEVLGYKQIKNDFIMRLLDIPTLANRLYSEFPLKYKKYLQDYSDGVNEGFKTGKNADEFIKLGYGPNIWLPQDSVAVMLLQSFDQTKKTFYLDVKEEEILEKYPDAKELFNENDAPWMTTILKNGEYKKSEGIVRSINKRRTPLKLWANFPELFGENSGSNNWVLAPSKTKNNHAILANDPHLDLKTPLFWYWIHLKSSKHQSIGASLPGLPFIASGTNGEVSWGLTNSYFNSADSIEINDLQSTDINSSRPLIWFKLGFIKLPFFFKSIERFKNVYPVLPLDVPNKDRVILRWTGYSLKASEVTPMFDLHQSQNVREINTILGSVGVPSWNFVFADTGGKIGFRMVGRTYQNIDDPFGVRILSTEEFLNPPILSVMDRPHVVNSNRPYIVTANNQHLPKDSFYKGGRSYSLSLRANRIEEEIFKIEKHDIASTQKIQCDLFVKEATYFIPLIQKYIPNFLSTWDMFARDQSTDLSLYRRLMDLMMKEWEVNESALYKILNSDKKGLGREIEEIYKRAKLEVGDRSWEEIAKTPFEHLSGDSSFQYSPILSALGDMHTVGPGTTRWNKSDKQYEHFSGASMRMIVEMSRPVRVLLNLPGKNRDYQLKSEANPWRDWRECKYFEVSF